MSETRKTHSANDRRQPYISLTSWASPYSLSERHREGKPARAEIHFVVPHGKGTRGFVVELTFDQCLALCANAADAARLLKNVRDE